MFANISLSQILLLTIGFGSYLGLMYISRKIQNSTFSTLEADAKQIIFTAFVPFRKFSMIPGVVLLVLYFILIKFTGFNPMALNISFGVLYIVYLVSLVFYIRAKLIKLNVDPMVVFKIVSALAIQYLGMLVVIGAIVIYYYVKLTA